MRLIASLTTLAIIAMVAVGCGGGDDDSTGNTASLTKAEFVKQGDAICAKANKRTEGEFETYAKENNFSKSKKPSKAQQEKMIAAIALPSIAKQSEELDELDAPSGEEDKVNAIVKEVEKAVKTAEADPSLVFSRSGPFTEANKLAKEFGFTVCGQ